MRVEEEDKERTIRQRSSNPSTGRMATNNHLLHLQMRDRVRDHGLAGQVGGRQHVGDVAVHEDVAWLQAQDGGFRDPAVGAADPEDLRRLAFAQLGHQVWVVAAVVGGPVFVFREGMVDWGVCFGVSLLV